ncbi:hypothetical protein HK104_008327 [Borealophlyctis nickersoniae]|nr:hypothetical protein HK104_008327 [Borealophlyctis nickersoniae]
MTQHTTALPARPVFGPTELVRLNDASGCEIFGKIEYLGSTGSFHDRLAASLFEKPSFNPQIKKIVIGGSENFAVSVAALARRYNAKVISVLPENARPEKVQLLKALGVDIVRTPAGAHPSAPESHLPMARRIAEQSNDALLVNEETCWEDARNSLLSEIEQQLPGRQISALVISAAYPLAASASKIITVPPVDLESYEEDFNATSRPATPPAGQSMVGARDACLAARNLMSQHGLLCGVGSGAALAAATAHASGIGKDTIVVLLGDSAKDFASTLLDEDWLLQHGIVDPRSREEAEQKFRGASVEDLQLGEAISIVENHPVGEAIELMVSRDFSQLPVINARRKIVGLISLGKLQAHINSGEIKNMSEPVSKWMYLFSRRGKFELITPATPLADLESFFERHPAALVTDESGKFPLAVVTKYDLLKFLSKRGG